jgi:hypothetical protein
VTLNCEISATQWWPPREDERSEWPAEITIVGSSSAYEFHVSLVGRI